MKITEWMKLFLEQFDADKSQYILEKIYENDRWFDYKSFNKTAQVCFDYMKEIGLEEVALTPLRADGKTVYGDWGLPKAWDVNHAVLTMLEDGKKTVIADRMQNPCTISIGSASSPAGGVTAELMAVEADEADTPAIKGKLLLTTKAAQTLVQAARKHGAAGIISDFFPLYPGVRDSRAQMHETVRWDNNFIAPASGEGLFAFNITPDTGGMLRTKLAAGKVTLHADVSVDVYDGECSTISGAILGSEPEAKEIMLYGHLYEHGAHDNASGCALFLELMRVAAALVKEGKIERPKHTIRVVMGYECTGSTGWLVENAKEAERTMCGIVADMVGTEKIDNSVMTVRMNPLSNYSFIDSALVKANEVYRDTFDPSYNWIITKFQIASDNMIGDPSWGIPMTAMISEPALSYHSSMDTPDRIEKPIMKRNGALLGGLVLAIAQAGAEESEWLLDSVNNDIDTLVAGGKTEVYRYIMESARVNSAALLKEVCGDALCDCAMAKVKAPAKPAILLNPAGVPCEQAKIVPKRLVKGCLTFAGKPELGNSEWSPAWNTKLHFPLFWADGTRNLWEIAVLASAEVGQEDKIAENFAKIYSFFSFLEKHKYMSFEVNA